MGVTTTAATTAVRTVNRNVTLYGPGPVSRTPTGWVKMYHNPENPTMGFALMASHGIFLSCLIAYGVHKVYLEPEAKAIKDYYALYPPKRDRDLYKYVEPSKDVKTD